MLIVFINSYTDKIIVMIIRYVDTYRGNTEVHGDAWKKYHIGLGNMIFFKGPIYFRITPLSVYPRPSCLIIYEWIFSFCLWFFFPF